LGVALAAFTLAMLLPPPLPLRGRAPARVAVWLAAALLPSIASAAESGSIADEVLLRPKRLAGEGRREFDSGNHPAALEAFEKAARTRPADPAAKFNLADALYKNGRFDDAATIYRGLGEAPASPLAPAARYNLGNALYQKKDYPGAVAAYKDALRLAPHDPDTTRNLELALRAQQPPQQQSQKPDQQQPNEDDQRKDAQKPQPSGQASQKPPDAGRQPEPPKSEEEKERERFQKETGMPKERAMQLLDALQQNEKQEQRRALTAKAPEKKPRKDW
jgi:Ca-activated chloride channel family protein